MQGWADRGAEFDGGAGQTPGIYIGERHQTKTSVLTFNYGTTKSISWPLAITQIKELILTPPDICPPLCVCVCVNVCSCASIVHVIFVHSASMYSNFDILAIKYTV